MRSFQFKPVVAPMALILCLIPKLVFSQNSDLEPIVPQNLLKLIHTPEVQAELGLDSDERLSPILRDLDRTWWPARILPEAKQVETNRALEARLLDELKPLLTAAKLRRLREIEAQSQGTRALIRPVDSGQELSHFSGMAGGG